MEEKENRRVCPEWKKDILCKHADLNYMSKSCTVL